MEQRPANGEVKDELDGQIEEWLTVLALLPLTLRTEVMMAAEVGCPFTLEQIKTHYLPIVAQSVTP